MVKLGELEEEQDNRETKKKMEHAYTCRQDLAGRN